MNKSAKMEESKLKMINVLLLGKSFFNQLESINPYGINYSGRFWACGIRRFGMEHLYK